MNHKILRFLVPLFFYFLVLVGENMAQNPTVSSGKVERYQNFTSQYVQARNIDVWLPEDYKETEKYAVLYMQDGQMLFDSTSTWNKQAWEVDETVGSLLKEGKLKPCIVVGIWNNGGLRRSEYFPQKPFETLTAFQQDTLLKSKRNNQLLFSEKVQSDNYLKFLVQELKPFIDSHYATYRNRKNTFVAGSSMGGLISLYAICEYPRIFGGAACLSTHWTGIFTTQNNPIPDALIAYLHKKLPSKRKHKIYFDYGTITLDSLYPPYQKKVDFLMKSKGFGIKQWITKEFKGKDHSEKAWRERFYIPLLFLLGNSPHSKIW